MLAEKLTETARNIVWLDPEKDRPQEASKEQIAALQERLGYRWRNLYLLRCVAYLMLPFSCRMRSGRGCGRCYVCTLHAGGPCFVQR